MKKILLRAQIISACCFGLEQHAAAQTIWTNGGPDMNWSTANNWIGGVVPVNGVVLFTNVGQVVNASNINNIVDSGFGTLGGSITSLQYSHTNGNHTTLIASGQTLTITGG